MGWAEKALEAIKARGGKLTPQRLKIVRVVEELGPEHPSLKEVLEKVREEFPTISFSTLYNNILILREAGLLHIFYHRGEARVEVNTSPHINIVEGGIIKDIDYPEIVEELGRRLGRRILFINAYVRAEEGGK